MKSLEIVKQEVAGTLATIPEIKAKAGELIVVNPEQEKEAILFLAPIKELIKTVDAKRKEYVNPANEFVKMINGFFQPRIRELEAVEIQVKGKLGDYRRKVEEAARKEQERIDRENQKKQEAYQEKMRKEAEKAEALGREEKFVAPPIFREAAPVAKSISTEAASVNYKTVKKWRLVSLDAVPRDFLVLDEKKISAAVKAGIAVSGIEVYEEKEVALRAR